MAGSQQPIISTLSLHQGHNSQLMPGYNNNSSLTMSNSPEHFYITWTLANRKSINKLTSSFKPARVSLFSLLLTLRLPKEHTVASRSAYLGRYQRPAELQIISLEMVEALWLRFLEICVQFNFSFLRLKI